MGRHIDETGNKIILVCLLLVLQVCKSTGKIVSKKHLSKHTSIAKMGSWDRYQILLSPPQHDSTGENNDQDESYGSRDSDDSITSDDTVESNMSFFTAGHDFFAKSIDSL